MGAMANGPPSTFLVAVFCFKKTSNAKTRKKLHIRG